MNRQTWFITYADEAYSDRQQKLHVSASASGQFDCITSYGRRWLEKHPVYLQHKNIFNEPRGAGYWLFKPLIILETLKQMNDGDVLLYIDCGDAITETNGLRETLLSLTEDNNVVLTAGAFPNYQYCKRDCFVLMEMDTEEAKNDIQIEAGIIVVKKTEWAIKIMQEWFEWCTDRRVVTDDENTCGLPNYEGFRDSRHDQQILSLLALKYGVFRTSELRRFIHCNKND